MNVWLMMLALAAGTFLLRGSFILLFGHREFNPVISRALRFVPAAVLSALVVPQFLIRDHSIVLGLANPQLLAGLVATIVSWRTKNVLLTILSGMVVLWLLLALAPAP